LTPWQKAKAWQDAHSTQDFWQALGWHLSSGLVWSSPNAFMLAHEVFWCPERQEVVHDETRRNAWFVVLAGGAIGAGAVGELLRVAPHRHEFALWSRRGESRVRSFNWDKLIKKGLKYGKL
jgi:hypothetical protein